MIKDTTQKKKNNYNSSTNMDKGEAYSRSCQLTLIVLNKIVKFKEQHFPAMHTRDVLIIRKRNIFVLKLETRFLK